ncbi:CUB domain-containing protein 2-like [Haliotis asinina]|uniref:CUB domain-containing protein 2-like n=1 Tax=Haliotis asinina TaxID=109174 RepID=UPI0035327BEE
MNMNCFLSVCALLLGSLVSCSGDSSCGGCLVATSVGKTFTSPGYPNTDLPALARIWTITAERNHTILLSTIDSVLENYNSFGTCDRDYVTVCNSQDGSDELGTFCGHQQPVFASSGNTMRVSLQTDGGTNHKGFKMMYKAVPETTCNVTLPAGPSPIQLVSPGYPSNHHSGLDCKWTITAPFRTNVNVDVLYISMVTTPSCLNDYLLFTDGPATDDTQLAKICEDPFIPIISMDNYMTIIFHTESSVTGQGFRLQYSNDFTCGTTDLRASPDTERYLTSPGFPSSYYYNLQCTWTISASTGYNVKVSIESLDVKKSTSCDTEYILFSDGSSSKAAALGKYCDSTGRDVIASSNLMTVTFHTDGSARRRGFSLKYTSGRFLTTTTVTPYVPSCGTTKLSASSKWTQLSPSPPGGYTSKINCSWTISALVGNVVSVQLEELSMGASTSCAVNYLLLSDGSRANAAKLARYCGSTTGNVMSSNKDVTVTFHTIGRAEFTLRYKAIPSGCGEDKVIDHFETVYVQSPNYPLYYPRHSNCAWTISTDIRGYVIYVVTVEFNLISDAMCTDYLKLYNVDGPNEYLIGQWCGYGGPNIRSTEMAVRVRFHSESYTTYIGFKLAFIAAKPRTAPFLLPNTGTVLGYTLGFTVALVVIIICCCGICIKKKSTTNDQSIKSVTNAHFVPGHSYTATTSTTLPASSAPSTDSLQVDHGMYCQPVPGGQPLVTLSPRGPSALQGIDNPACLN